MTYQDYAKQPSPIRRMALAEQAYIDYFNNYLTVALFAEAYECTKEEALDLINTGRHWNHLPKIEAVEA